MNRRDVLAERENDRIKSFMDAMIEKGRMTKFEKQVVLQEGVEVLIQAGLLDGRGKNYQAKAKTVGITRQSNHMQRQKIVEMHPEMQGELEEFIEHRPHHPLPPVPPRLAGRGAALKQYMSQLEFIERKRSDDVITNPEAYAMFDLAIRVFEDSGHPHYEVDANTDKSLLIQAHHLIKEKLLELHPELATELREFGSKRER